MTAPAEPLRGYRFRPPVEQRGHLSRPRLVQFLDERITEEPTMVVVAPSGYGKTSAVAEWASNHRGRVSWLSLNPFDVKPRHLTSSVVRALQALITLTHDPLLAPLAALDPTDIDAATAFDLIAAALVEVDEPVYLVIDNAHQGQDALAVDLLGALIEIGCEGLRVVVIGTSYIEVVLNRLVLTRPRAVLRAHDLAFTLTELEQLYAGAPPPYDIESMLEESRGWPIALRYVQVSGVRPDTHQPSGVVLEDYVRDHVLGAIPSAVAHVVLETSVCSELTAGLAAAVTGRDDAGELLESCVRMGLFLDRYEHSGQIRYRWHSLFVKQCRQILGRHDDGRREKAIRAAASYLEHREPLTAASYWLAAGENERAIDTILDHWLRLVVGPDAGELDHWCAELPEPYAGDPRILLIRACVQRIEGREEIARILAARTQGPASPARLGDQTVRLVSQMLLLDDQAEVAAAAALVRTHMTSSSLETHDRAALYYLLGLTELRHRSSPEIIVQMLTAATADAEAVRDQQLAQRSRVHLAFATAWAGQLTQAQIILEHPTVEATDDEGTWWMHMGGGGPTTAGFCAYWQDDLELATAEFTRAILARTSKTSFAGVARMMLGATAAATRDPRACRFAAREVAAIPTQTLQGASWPAFRHAAQATLYEAGGQRSRAMRIVEQYEQARSLPVVTVLLAGVATRSGYPGRAVQMLGRLDRYREISYVQVPTLLTEAVVQHRRGRREQARELTERALDIAVREDLRRPLAGGGIDVRQLLTEQLSAGTAHEEFIVASLTPKERKGPLHTLSERERAVFSQLRTTRTAQEIADHLHVSINTLKTHQRSIYRKLGVTSRREAVRLFG